MPIDVSGFNVGEIPLRDEGATARLAQNMWRNREWKYRQQRQQDEDQWKKVNFLAEYTDPSKYKTGVASADAITNDLMGKVLQKYSAQASTTNPLELIANVNRETTPIITGAQGLKDELTAADKQMQSIKQENPSLDSGTMYDDYRKEIVGRHINDNADNFRNPMEIGQSKFNLNDQNLLSKYVRGMGGLQDYFANPKGGDDITVSKGSDYSYTPYKAKIYPWRTPNYDPSKLREGFLPHNAQEPHLGYKTSTLPLQDHNVEVMDSEIYDNLPPNVRVELKAAARKKYGDVYDNKFNPTEQQYAERNVLSDVAKTFDKSDFHPGERKNPSAAMTKIFMGDTGKGSAGALTINDVYGDIDKSLGEWEKQGSSSMMPFQNLSQDAKDVLIPKLQQNQKARNDDGTVDTQDLKLVRANDGALRVFKSDGDYVMDVGKKNTNIEANKKLPIKSREGVVKQSQQEEHQSNYLIKGKTYSEKELTDMGYTKEQIAQYKK